MVERGRSSLVRVFVSVLPEFGSEYRLLSVRVSVVLVTVVVLTAGVSRFLDSL